MFDKDRALSRRFQKIDLVEPSADETFLILKGLRARYEEFHGVRYTDPALRAAADLAAKHMTDRHLPDKTIDVIDEAGAAMRILPGGVGKSKKWCVRRTLSKSSPKWRKFRQKRSAPMTRRSFRTWMLS